MSRGFFKYKLINNNNHTCGHEKGHKTSRFTIEILEMGSVVKTNPP